MDKINQTVVSAALSKIGEVFHNIYHLKVVTNNGEYDINAPCLFTGIYFKEDLMRIQQHTGYKVVMFGGSDIRRDEMINPLRNANVDKFISISNYIENRLTNRGIDSIKVRIATTDVDYWKPEPLGKGIYAYAPDNRCYQRYLIEEIASEINHPVYITISSKDFTRERLYEVYKECFMGLRLTRWDGNAATVQELGLMGRKTVWNEYMPCAIKWETKKDIKKTIMREAKKIGQTDIELSGQTKQALDLTDKWLEVC